MTKKIAINNDDINYGYYSKLLKQPFDSIAELREAEAKHYAEIKAKEDKAAAKKADAQKVEEAFKALNAARRTYKEKLTTLTAEYSDALTELKKTFEFGRNDIYDKLAAAETAYQSALKEFTDKYNHYHMCLKDGDFETTIASHSTRENRESDNSTTAKAVNDLFELFNLLYRI